MAEPLTPIRIAPPALDLEAVRGVEENIALSTGNDRQEPLYLWDDSFQKLKQITDTDLRSLCFPDWRPTEAAPVKNGQPIILSYGLGADSTALLLKYLTDEERGFPLENLIAITALVGREWDETVDKVQRFILPLLRQHHVLPRDLLMLPWAERFTTLEQTTPSKKSTDLFTLHGWRDANKELLADLPPEEWATVATDYWKAIAEVIPQWRDLLVAVEQDQTVDAPALRQDYICFHSITLSALGLLGRQLINESGLPDLSGLATVDWSRSNPDWEGIFLFEGKIIKNKQSAQRLAEYLVEG